MATVTGYTAQRMKQIEDKAIVDGEVQTDNLILFARDGTNIDAGNVRGPKGDRGPTGEVSQADLTAATSPSSQAGNDIIKGSDTKLFFDHDSKYLDHVPKFVSSVARDTAIPAPVTGQLCVVAGALQIRDGNSNTWVNMTSSQLMFFGELNANFAVGQDSVFIPVPFDVRTIDVYTAWQAGSAAWRAPRAGQISVSGRCTLTIPSSGAINFMAAIFNGSTEYRFHQFQGTCMTTSASGTVEIPVAVNDLISLKVYMTAAGQVKTVFGSKMTAMSVRYIA